MKMTNSWYLERLNSLLAEIEKLTGKTFRVDKIGNAYTVMPENSETDDFQYVELAKPLRFTVAYFEGVLVGLKYDRNNKK